MSEDTIRVETSENDTVIGDTMKGGLGEFPNTAKGMCELSKAASDYFAKSADPDQTLVGTIEAWLLPYGKEFEYRPRPDWLPRGTPKRCFTNSFALVISIEGEEHGLRYCEGYIRDPTCPMNIHHAWTVTPEGVVVDPTLPEEQWPEDKISYFGFELPDVSRFARIIGSAEQPLGCLLDNRWGRALVEDIHKEANHDERQH